MVAVEAVEAGQERSQRRHGADRPCPDRDVRGVQVIVADPGLKLPVSATGAAVIEKLIGCTTAGPASGATLVPVYVTFPVPTATALRVQVT
jgi:hypothetical protein